MLSVYDDCRLMFMGCLVSVFPPINHVSTAGRLFLREAAKVRRMQMDFTREADTGNRATLSHDPDSAPEL